MAQPLTVEPRRAFQTFMDFPLVRDLDALDAHVAIMGIPYGDPYGMWEVTNDQTNAPTAIRRASDSITMGLDRWDFDFGGTLFDGKDIRVVDVGDIDADAHDIPAHYKAAEEAIRRILRNGARPVVFGGDHGVPIPVMRGLAALGREVTLVQVDAHIDWRDEVNGRREGYSSPIRRASEMEHIGEIFQLGIRCSGSARAEEVEAARAYGANIVTAWEIHDAGMAAILDRIPDGGTYYLTIDADGMDPAAMPAVMAPAPGGLTFDQVRRLIHGLTAKGDLIGMDVNEIAPRYDVNAITCYTAGRLAINYIGAAVRAGYFG